jgi:hypothetical protein
VDYVTNTCNIIKHNATSRRIVKIRVVIKGKRLQREEELQLLFNLREENEDKNSYKKGHVNTVYSAVD